MCSFVVVVCFVLMFLGGFGRGGGGILDGVVWSYNVSKNCFDSMPILHTKKQIAQIIFFSIN